MSEMKLISVVQLKQQEWKQTKKDLKNFDKLGIAENGNVLAVLVEPDFYEELFLAWIGHHIRLGNLVGG